jgi:hypothetical protein
MSAYWRQSSFPNECYWHAFVVQFETYCENVSRI